jgi:hypothetical protein
MLRKIGLLGSLFISVIFAQPKYLTSILVGGEYRALAVEKGNIYLATGRGLEIASPRMAPLGAVGTPGDASDIVVRGRYAYIADGEKGISVIDIRKPEQPVLVNSVYLSGPVRVLAAEGGYLFAGMPQTQCSILDLADPKNPKEVATIPVENDIYGITVSNNLLFLALESSLEIYNIKNPKDPKPVGQINSQVVTVAVAGTTLYLVGGPIGLTIFDIKDPSQPKQLSQFDTEGYTSDVKVSKGLVYLADQQGGLKIFDVRNPAAPKLIGQYSAIPASVYKIALSGTNCYLALGIHTMRWIDVSNAERPVMKGQFGRRSMIQDVDISGRYGVVTDSNAGLLLFDFSEPGKPIQYETEIKNRDVRDVGLVGPSIYLAQGLRGVMILNAKTAPRLSIAKELGAIGTTQKMVPYHSNFLVTNQEGVLGVLEICTCGPLRTLSVINTGGKITDVVGIGERVFVADEDSGLFVYDLGLPTKPKLLEKIGLFKPVVITGYDSLLFIGDTAGDLEIVNPLQPDSVISTIALPTVLSDLAYADGFLYCALGVYGFWVVDVKNPKEPKVVLQYDTPGTATRLATDGNLLLVADSYSVEVFKVK